MDSFWIAIATLLTTIAGFIYTWLRDARNRKWALEDAAKKAEHLARQDEAIEDSKKAAENAFREANQFNKKFAYLKNKRGFEDEMDQERPSGA